MALRLEMSVSETTRLFTVPMLSLSAFIESSVCMVKRQISGQRRVTRGALRGDQDLLFQKETRDCYSLFVATEDLQQPISPEAITVTSQRVFLNTQRHVHCCVWVYATCGLSSFLQQQHVIASSACNMPMNIGIGSKMNERKLHSPTNCVF